MEEITLQDLRGIWLGDEYNLVVGLFNDGNYGSLVIRAEQRIVETRDLSLGEISGNGTRILHFNDDFSIEIWQWNKPDMIIIIENANYDLRYRGY